MEIKRSDVEKWVLADNKYACAAYADDWFECAKNPHATVFGELSPAVQAVLKNAPRECRQYRATSEWMNSTRPPMNDSAYRLHPDCVLVDDVRESKWVEYKIGLNCADRYIVDGGPVHSHPLHMVTFHKDFVCIKVRDASGTVGYVAAWGGPYAWRSFYPDIESLVDSYIEALDGVEKPLTPIAVVFEKEVNDV